MSPPLPLRALLIAALCALALPAPLHAAAPQRAGKAKVDDDDNGRASPAKRGADVGADEGEEDHETGEDSAAIIVEGTRFANALRDEPLRVEVLDGEEVGEKTTMRPGNIAMLLGEIGGVRVQVTSPALGAANIRMQGLEGRYTQLLADGLPLYGGQAGGLGLLQVPPTDLAQVEVIKGAVSALYGGSALGGVINLVSKRPGDAFEGEVLANATSLNGQDLTAYLAGPLSGASGLSLTLGAHRQRGQDLDGDGWQDIAGYERVTARPRFAWEGADGARLYLTGGFMFEDRTGGTLPGRAVPDGTSFVQAQRTERWDAGLVATRPLGEDLKLAVRAAAMRQDHRHRFGPAIEIDRHSGLFAETTLAATRGATGIVVGAAFQSDGFASRSFPGFDYSYDVPALFAQVEQEAGPALRLSGSVRADFHNVYGTQVSPRLAALWRPGAWRLRASVGGGFFAPTPFVDAIEAAGLARLAPLTGLRAERARNASLDLGWREGPWEANLTVFGTDLAHATRLETIAPAGGVRLVNIAGLTRLRGTEALLRWRAGRLLVAGSYVFVASSEPDPALPGVRREVPLTPRHTAGIDTLWEVPGKGRIGIEAYYTSSQSLEDDPYRTRSRPFLLLGVLGEVTLGRVRVFVNAENLLDVRQSRYAPLLRRVRAPSGEWTVDAWAPLEGASVNVGIKLELGRG